MRVSHLQLVTVLVTGLGLLGSMSGCGKDGSPPGAEGCRSQTSCATGYYCAGPNDRTRCGVPPREQCDNSASCPGEVCHAIDDGCSPDGVGSQCGPECTATSCGPGFRCNAQKSCEPIPCDEGFTCPSYQRCDAVAAHSMGPVHARTSGCVPIACSMDKDCPTGKACVNAACADGPGMCRLDIAVP